MSERIAVSANPQITIKSIDGDLRLVGWDVDEILLKTDTEALDLQHVEDHVTLSCTDDMSINVPKGAAVTIGMVRGDISVRGLTGTLKLDSINGDVAIRDAGQLDIGSIEGDFSLRAAKGDVHVKHVGGDASLRGVDGSLKLDSVSDDLAVRGVGGNLAVDVDDDVVVHLNPKPDQEYSVVAGDDIMLVLPEDANATLNLSGNEININFPNVELDDSTSQVVTLGEGAAKINLNAGNRVLVSTTEGAPASADDFSNFAGLVFDFENFGREFGEQWGSWGNELGGRISRKAAEAAERASRKAEAAARRMERQAKQHERQARKAVRKGTKFSWTFDSSKFPHVPKPSEPVSDEERMKILQMLSDKKISAEQAEELLSALEGGE